MHARTRAAVLSVVVAAIAQSAVAQTNLIQNGSFDDDVSGWQDVTPPGEGWADSDAAANPDSGSVRIFHSGVQNSGLYVEQCIPVTAGETYTYGASTLLSETLGTSGRSDVDLIFWSVPACENLVAGGEPALSTVVTGAWIDLQTSTVAPPGAVAATLTLITVKLSGAPSDRFDVYYDDAFVFAPEPDATALGAAAIASLWARRRARRR
jgi:hypothetical protein